MARVGFNVSWQGQLVAVCVGLLIGCGSDATLPDDELPVTGPTDSDPGTFTTDTTGTDDTYNEEPDHWLTLSQLGNWALSPIGSGPYTTMTGSLVVTELLDDDEETPWCTAEFSLTGTIVEDPCDGCEFAVEVSHYLVSEGVLDEEGEPVEDEDGDPIATLDLCETPDLPTDGAVWRMALHDTEQKLYLDFGDSGIWMPWYPITRVRHDVDFQWEAQVGYRPEEDE